MSEEKKEKKSGLWRLARQRKWPLLAAGVLLGVLLLCFGGGANTGEAERETGESITSYRTELDAYAEKTENELRELCASVAGVSDVEIFLSFSRGYTSVYVTDGTKNPVTVGSSSQKEALTESILPPEVGGVGVVCRGGNRADVQKTLTELISTSLGIPSSRVFVTGK